MQIRKIKDDGKTVEIQWEAVEAKGVRRVSYESRERPAPAFVQALARMRGWAAEVLEMRDGPGEYLASAWVQSVSINYEEGDGRRGCVVTLLRTVSGAHSPVVLNTPHLREYADEQSSIGFMPTPMLKDLIALCLEASKYVAGERAQMDLLGESANG